VARGIISKLPPSWKDFATSLKHKRQEFVVVDLIGTLDVEEKARAKDSRGKGIAGSSSANLVQKKNHNAFKKNNPHQNQSKAKQTALFKQKKPPTGKCYCCGSMEHFVAKCPDRKDKKDGKSANMVISETGGTSGYGNLLPTVLLVCHSPDWWIDTGANIHVCADIS
jgi:hypothetical protein